MVVQRDKMKNTGIKLFLLGIILGLNTSFAPHPLHSSIAEAHWKKDRKVIEVSVELFFNDFETSLTQHHGRAIHLCPDNIGKHSKAIEAYFQEYFKLSVNERKRQFKLVGYECERDLAYVYLEYIGIKKLKKVTIENRLLFESFSDQTNTVHLHAKGESNTLLTHLKDPIAHLDL